MKIGCSLSIVDLHIQAPNRNRYESKYFWDEFYTLVSAAGFSTVEIPYEPKWDFGGRSGVPRSHKGIEYKFGSVGNYGKFLADAGIEKVAGLHYDPAIFFQGNLDRYFGACLHFGEDAFKMAGQLGCEYLSLSLAPPLGALLQACPEQDKQQAFIAEFVAKTADMVEKMASMAAEAGVVLCLKNEYWSALRGEKIFELLGRFKGSVRLDLDTANLAIAGVDPVRLIEQHFDSIGCVHLTDTAFHDDANEYMQLMPAFPKTKATQVFRDLGQGEIDFAKIIAALRQRNYQGPVIWNSPQTRDACRALLRARHLIDTDFVKRGEKS